MRRVIKVNFTDFWHGNSTSELLTNPFYVLLSRNYQLELSVKPDFLFYSCFGKKFLKYDCTRVFYTGENVRPNFDQCDYAFSFDYLDTERNYRLPLYHLYGYSEKLGNKGQNVPDPSRQKFCNFVYSNKKASGRIEFLRKLMHYKTVDCGGKIMNNIGGRVGNKLDFLRGYKFTIAFENSSYPGYTTEKIAEALLANTIPIYWGNPLVARDFNPDGFINCHDFNNFDEVIDHVIRVDKDDDLYRKYISAPAFTNRVDNEFVNAKNLSKQFEMIFAGPRKSEVASSFDKLKYWIHPARPRDYAAFVTRHWKHKRREQNAGSS